jgi:opacity protein-like surface antigen
MKNIITKMFLLCVVVTFTGCIYGGQYVVRTVTNETINKDGTVTRNTTQENIPVEPPPRVVYPASSGYVEPVPVYNYGGGYDYYGFGYDYGYGFGAGHKGKVTTKTTYEEKRVRGGGHKSTEKTTTKWHNGW